MGFEEVDAVEGMISGDCVVTELTGECAGLEKAAVKDGDADVAAGVTVLTDGKGSTEVI